MVPRKSHDIEEALKGILDIIMNTVISSGRQREHRAASRWSRRRLPADSGIPQGDPDDLDLSWHGGEWRVVSSRSATLDAPPWRRRTDRRPPASARPTSS